jgi:hypothetical protein
MTASRWQRHRTAANSSRERQTPLMLLRLPILRVFGIFANIGFAHRREG